MKANLHFHSRYSDGTQWPEEMVARGKRVGLELMALTDHDSMEGVESFLEACKVYKIKALPGVEIDCVVPEIDYNSEMLAYFPTETSNYIPMKEWLLNINENREKAIIRAINNIKEIYKTNEISIEELYNIKYGFSNSSNNKIEFSYTRYDLYKYLVQKKVLENEISYDAFRGDKRIFSDVFEKKHLKTVVEIVKNNNGYLSLPHPGHIYKDSYEELEKNIVTFEEKIAFIKELGVNMVELYCYRNKNVEKINELIKTVGKKLSMKFTYGSDCHGRGSGVETLEQFYGKFEE